MMSPIGVGILGCGNISRIHAEAVKRVESLKLVSVCSRSINSAEQLASQHGVPAYAELGKFLGDKGIQMVSICTPSGTHSALGCAAARAGKHVLVEKPIDINLEKTDALIAACKKSGVRLAVCLQSRFLEAPRALKEAVELNRLGNPVLASAYVKWYRTTQYYASARWRGTLELDGGGALINQAIHTVDLLQWIMGPVAEVHAYSNRLLHRQIEGEDTLVAVLRFRNNALGVLEAATSVYPGFKRRLEITGSEGTAVLEGDNITAWSLRDGSPNPAPATGEVSDGSSNAMAIDCEGHRRIMDDFAQAIRDGRRPAVDGEEGRRSLELVMALYSSTRLGKTVAL